MECPAPTIGICIICIPSLLIAERFPDCLTRNDDNWKCLHLQEADVRYDEVVVPKGWVFWEAQCFSFEVWA